MREPSWSNGQDGDFSYVRPVLSGGQRRGLNVAAMSRARDEVALSATSKSDHTRQNYNEEPVSHSLTGGLETSILL